MTWAVLDSSAAASLASNSDGFAGWVEEQLRERSVAAPELLPYEFTNVIRRFQRSGLITAGHAVSARALFAGLDITWWPFDATVDRAWGLRGSVTVYDASYVAVAEALNAVLLTLDRKLAAAPGPRCEIRTPPMG